MITGGHTYDDVCKAVTAFQRASMSRAGDFGEVALLDYGRTAVVPYKVKGVVITLAKAGRVPGEPHWCMTPQDVCDKLRELG